MCACVQDTPLFSLKWWPASTTEAWAQSLHILLGKQRPPGDLRLTSTGAVATLQLSWPCEMAPTTTLTGHLGSSVWCEVCQQCCVPSTTSWIPFQRPPGPVGTYLGTGSGPSQAPWIQHSYPNRHNWHHSAPLEHWRILNLKKFKPVTHTQTNKKDSNFSDNTVEVSPKWLSSPNVYLDK